MAESAKPFLRMSPIRLSSSFVHQRLSQTRSQRDPADRMNSPCHSCLLSTKVILGRGFTESEARRLKVSVSPSRPRSRRLEAVAATAAGLQG